MPFAVKACEAGVKRTHLISRKVDGGLLIELFTHHGIGTMIVPRIAGEHSAASREDVPGIAQILEPLEQQGILVRRTTDDLERDLDHFFVIESEGEHSRLRGDLPVRGERDPRSSPRSRSIPFYRDGGRGERPAAVRRGEGEGRRV
jgi:amino-acid N-acetyltransferase